MIIVLNTAVARAIVIVLILSSCTSADSLESNNSLEGEIKACLICIDAKVKLRVRDGVFSDSTVSEIGEKDSKEEL